MVIILAGGVGLAAKLPGPEKSTARYLSLCVCERASVFLWAVSTTLGILLTWYSNGLLRFFLLSSVVYKSVAEPRPNMIGVDRRRSCEE